MSTVAGIFQSRADAESAVENLRSAGIAEDRINLLMPGTRDEQVEESVPTTETEQPGMGSAMGGAVGGALGAAGGMTIGATVASLLVPGVGPVLAAGVLGAALFGAGGAAAGSLAGGALEDSVEGLPHDELYIYEDALRQGRSVVIVLADDEAQAEAARGILKQAGAESLDAAREDWWVGLRDAEEEHYAVQGGDFKKDEAAYRRGFEAAQHPRVRDKGYDEVKGHLLECYGEDCELTAFRSGYDRGQSYQRNLREKYKG
ncbi:MAG: hypothetical protein M3362_20045 [Acidobacteriota bacterium]|nr:hypothetical protein [Acidobacteriota bacterium]